MSSDFLSRPFDPKRYDLIYAHAQKNIGPAGVTVVVIDKHLLEQVPEKLPELLDYRAHLQAHSIFNTPPVFAIYVVLLVTRWLLKDIGGLAGHRSLGGIRASIYNGMTQPAVAQLAEFMREFARNQYCAPSPHAQPLWQTISPSA